jgi:DNA invertase Pin-like site-specific DNA recombinase
MTTNQRADNVKTNVFSYVRWSSKPQERGDSERRQLEAAQEWCKLRGLTLSDSYMDRGVSAWKGKNQKHALGDLLKVIKPNDYLLIEDADRLSRQDWLSAMNFTASILDKGVTVVTLQNGNEITADRFREDPGCFLQAILRAHLGHDENQKKSFRAKQSWDARKQQLIEQGKPINHRLPAWLTWDKETDKPILNPRKTAVVRRIFDLCINGLGFAAIAKALKETPTISDQRSKWWSPAYVRNILTGRTALGYCDMVEPPVKCYPAAVDEKTFFTANAKIKERRHQTAPRKYAGTSSLFAGLCVCAKCGQPLFRNTSKTGDHRYQYLLCSGWRRGTCEWRTMRYDVFEQTFLGLLLAEDDALVRVLMTGTKEDASPSDENRGKLAQIQKEAEKILRMIDGDDNPSRRLADRLKSLEIEETWLQREIEAGEAKVQTQTPAAQVYEALRREFPVPVLEIKDRARLRELLRGLIEKIVVKLGENEFAVYFKGGRAPYGVKIFAASVKG